MKRLIVFALLTLFFARNHEAQGQGLCAFTDYRGYLMAFENGTTRQLEYLPPTSYKSGCSSIAYIDNRNDFKVYTNGTSKYQLNAADFKYWVTDYLVCYKVGQVLYVNDGGLKQTLCYYNTRMALGDSLLGYFDDSQYTLSVYYNHQKNVLENSLLEAPKAMKAGSNTLAWVNQSNFFSIFYRGNTLILDNIAPVEFAVGRDIMAWIDNYDQYFHIFYYGDTATAEVFAPDSFKVGNGILAYVDQQGNFNAFYNGGTRRLLSDRPDYFQVQGNVIVYAYNNQFNIFYQGKTYPVDSFVPTDFKLGLNGVAYRDPDGSLKFFQKGVGYKATNEYVNRYSVVGDVLKLEVGTNTNEFFWEGQLYQ